LEKITKKGLLKFVLKASLSTLAIYVVIQKIDLVETQKIIFQTSLGWLLLAFLMFNISKIISSIRLNSFFQAIGLLLSGWYNLRLYYIGMFYNLFLPGGIGGDGYKVYLLHKTYNTSVKQLVAASLLDRISGLFALVFLALAMGMFLDLSVFGNGISGILIALLIISYPMYYIVVKYVFKSFLKSFHISNLYSFGVQTFQLICAFFIFKSLGVQGLYLEYLTLFLISSVVAVLPFTIGGVGARELVFIFGANYFMIDKNTAVAFSILFFLITALSSFSGLFLKTGDKTMNMEEDSSDKE